MKILYSCLSKSWGGMEMVALTGIKQLISRNIQVELLCVQESRLQIEANNLGIIIHPVKFNHNISPYAIIKTAAVIRSCKYDLIHSHASKDLWALVPALKMIRSNTPLLLTKHVGSFIIKKDLLHKWIYKRLTLAIAISMVIKNNLRDTTPLNENKIILLPNGVDLKVFDPLKIDSTKIRSELKVLDNEILIGMIARFTPGKGHEEFLQSAKILSSKFNKLKFVVVGEASRGENEYTQRIKNLAEELQLQNVTFLGYRSDVPEIISAMDIFIFPSHAEAFGIALIEAMAMGKASVCSSTDGVMDIAVDGEANYMFNNKDYVDLANKIELLITNQPNRIEMGQMARQRIIEKFDLEKVTDEIINVYHNQIKKTTQ
jgi:glycosyltransferase involved in cell wall biosynthesis